MRLPISKQIKIYLGKYSVIAVSFVKLGAERQSLSSVILSKNEDQVPTELMIPKPSIKQRLATNRAFNPTQSSSIRSLMYSTGDQNNTAILTHMIGIPRICTPSAIKSLNEPTHRHHSWRKSQVAKCFSRACSYTRSRIQATTLYIFPLRTRENHSPCKAA